MIVSVSSKQTEILQSILKLNNLNNFDADLSYGNGVFYKDITPPIFKFDTDPQCAGVIKADSGSLPFVSDGDFKSIVFDPPFLTYIKSARSSNSIMARRFGGYWRYDELEDHYKRTIIEAARVLCDKGLLVFKCQDIIHNHKMHATHVNVINWSDGLFRLKDLFILPAKNRMPMPHSKTSTQRHARIHHSYFLVLERLKR